MIAFLRGKLVDVRPDQVILDVRDTGYQIHIPLSTFDRLPGLHELCELQTVLHIRENEHSLFGFATRTERDLFNLLVQHVSGVGPKLAIAVLGGLTPEAFQSAIATRDVSTLSSIKGLGKKTAERMVVELKDKMDIPDQWQPVRGEDTSPSVRRRQDAILALLSLGYKQPDALKALDQAGDQDDTESLVRAALATLNRP